MADLIADVVIDSIKDTVMLIPFLFATYVLIEVLEHISGKAAEHAVSRAGVAGPAVGALLGALPQCGFSAMAATLFSGGVVTIGTLIAVILSTSDELIPVFLAEGSAAQLIPIIVFKVAVGLVVGFIVDIVLHMTGHATTRSLCHCTWDDEQNASREIPKDLDSTSNVVPSHTHSHKSGVNVSHILYSAFVHTVQVALFIVLFSLVFGFAIEAVGENTLAYVLSVHPIRATFLAGLIGLIPNCGASVVIAQLFLNGSLASGPMIAGLLVSGGVGLLVLFRTNHDVRQNITIATFVYAIGVLCGLVVSALGIVF